MGNFSWAENEIKMRENAVVPRIPRIFWGFVVFFIEINSEGRLSDYISKAVANAEVYLRRSPSVSLSNISFNGN